MSILSQRLVCRKRVPTKAGCWWIGFFLTAVFGYTAEVAHLTARSQALAEFADSELGARLPDSFPVPAAALSLAFLGSDVGGATVFLKRGRATPGANESPPPNREVGERPYPGNVITMDPYVVLERTRVEYIAPPHRNRVLEVIKTGQLWKRVGRVVTSEASARIEADRGGYSRFTVRLGISW